MKEFKFSGKGVRGFVRSEDGSVITFWAVAFVAFMGLLALTFDIGRMSSTQSELQTFADNVALAAAGELDGAEDAIDRATNAAETLISDSQTFGTGDTVLAGSGDYQLTFYNGLPEYDNHTMIEYETTDPQEAGYVRVKVNDQSISLGYGAAFAALTSSAQMNDTVGASAVAGMTRSFCDITPLMFCIPDASYKAEDHIGSSVLLRSGGGGAAWGPGAFGFIDPSSNQIDDAGPCAGLTGAKMDTCLIAARGQRTGCFKSSGVDIASGQRVGNFESALNVRFDIFLSSMGSSKNDPDYAPAPNVIKGYTSAGQCLKNTATPSTNTVGLPPDDCFVTNTCGRFGDGDWSLGRQNYVDVNYNGNDPHPEANTRYEYYVAEIEAAGGVSGSGKILNGKAETGRPTCSPHQAPDAGRRVLVAAGIDCAAYGVGGGDKNVPVKEFYKIFLMSPIGFDGTRDLWVEIVGPAGGGGGGADENSVFSDVVRLHR